MKALGGLVRAMRPRQWTKNLFVFAPLLFSHDWHKEGKVLRTAATFAIFCLLSSGVYLMNDLADREADRLHPKKKTRPIAAGEVGVGAAAAAAVVLVLGALAWARFGLASNRVPAVCATYLVIQVLYTFWLKRVVIVDVMCIASGFVLRMIAGGTAAWVTASAWILVCTIFVSLFLALCKRRHEVVSLKDDAARHRAILADYPPALLDQLIAVATACILVTYALYTVDPRTAEAHSLYLDALKPDGKPQESPILAVTLPCVIFGIFRYLYLVYRREGGGSPTETLLKDAPTLVNGALYAALVVAVFHFAAR
jgi:4-hydroxybenzoate polyprenyltransferase